MSKQEFKPYRDLLGIPSLKDENPTDYQLLGIKDFEGDSGKVAAAHEKRTQRIAELYQMITNMSERIDEARDRISDPQKKEEYDNQLRRMGLAGAPRLGKTGFLAVLFSFVFSIFIVIVSTFYIYPMVVTIPPENYGDSVTTLPDYNESQTQKEVEALKEQQEDISTMDVNFSLPIVADADSSVEFIDVPASETPGEETSFDDLSGLNNPSSVDDSAVEQPAVEQPAEPEVPALEEPAVEQPAEPEVPAEEQPAVEQPAEPEVPALEQPAVEQPAEPEVPALEAPAVEQPAEPEVPALEEPAVEQPAEPEVPALEAPAVEQPAEPEVSALEQPAVEQPAEPEVPALEQPAVEQPAEPEVPALEELAVEEPAEPEVPALEQPAVEQPAEPEVPALEEPVVTEPIEPKESAIEKPSEKAPEILIAPAVPKYSSQAEIRPDADTPTVPKLSDTDNSGIPELPPLEEIAALQPPAAPQPPVIPELSSAPEPAPPAWSQTIPNNAAASVTPAAPSVPVVEKSIITEAPTSAPSNTIVVTKTPDVTSTGSGASPSTRPNSIADRVGSQLEVGNAETGSFGGITSSTRPNGSAPQLATPHSLLPTPSTPPNGVVLEDVDKLDHFIQLGQNAHTGAEFAQLLASARQAEEELMKEKQFKKAQQIADVVYASCARFAEKSYRAEAYRHKEIVSRRSAWWDSAQAAEAKMKSTGSLSPVEANIVARWKIEVENDWENGLTYLALNESEQIQLAVKRDRAANPENVRHCLIVANDWWNLAQDPVPLQKQYRQRACMWYAKALPSIEDKQIRTLVEKRISMAEQGYSKH